MTEAEWFHATHPQPMLEFLRSTGRTDERGLRLFAVACVRRVWDLLTDQRSRRVLEVVERFADGTCTRAELDAARDSASAVPWGDGRNAAVFATSEDAWLAASLTAYAVACAVGSTDSLHATADGARNAAYRALIPLLHEVLASPFRPSPTMPASLLEWNDGTVVKIARAIYDERGFEDLPILADTLEDAGCDNEDVLSHCRQQGTHVRGCWVLDLILSKR